MLYSGRRCADSLDPLDRFAKTRLRTPAGPSISSLYVGYPGYASYDGLLEFRLTIWRTESSHFFLASVINIAPRANSESSVYRRASYQSNRSTLIDDIAIENDPSILTALIFSNLLSLSPSLSLCLCLSIYLSLDTERAQFPLIHFTHGFMGWKRTREISAAIKQTQSGFHGNRVSRGFCDCFRFFPPVWWRLSSNEMTIRVWSSVFISCECVRRLYLDGDRATR